VPRGGSDGEKNCDTRIVVEEEEEGPVYANLRPRELGGEEKDVERGFGNVAAGKHALKMRWEV